MKFFLLAICLTCPAFAQAAKVIMKDGKTYEGRIAAEMDGNILFKTSPVNRPKLLRYEDILTVIRDPVLTMPQDPQKYVAFGLRLQGEVHASEFIEIQPAPSLALDASLRAHPFIELGANLDWLPHASGEFAATDGVSTRSYESFSAYGGGLWARFFPLYAYKWKVEPFLSVGYRWSNLIFAGSGGDKLKGQGIMGGAGVQGPVKKNLFWQAGFLYQPMSYGTINFLGRDGSLTPHVRSDAYTFFVGLSLHVI